VNPHQFQLLLFVCVCVFFTICAGCFFWTIVHPTPPRQLVRVCAASIGNLAGLLGALAVSFYSVLLLRPILYSGGHSPGHSEPGFQRAYLIFMVCLYRTIIFFGFWIVASLLLPDFPRARIKTEIFRCHDWMRRCLH